MTGKRGPIERLHPAIKGVLGAQSSGATLVSFNHNAFTSYGHKQGDNAPVSKNAVHAYATALNKFLDRDSQNRIQIGDASTVFWAEAPETDQVETAEAIAGGLFGDMPIDEGAQSARVSAVLERIRSGRPIAEAAPELQAGVRFFVLGLSPDTSRISVRYWLEDDFGVIAERFGRHLEALRLDPPPTNEAPS